MLSRLVTWFLEQPDEARLWASALATLLVVILAAWRVGAATGSVRESLLALMLGFEKARRKGQLGPVDGPAVLALVIDRALLLLVPQAPVWLRPFLTAVRLTSWVQGAYNLMMDYLDDGLLNGTRPEPLPDEDTPSDRVAASLDLSRSGGNTHTSNGDGSYSVKPDPKPPQGGVGARRL